MEGRQRFVGLCAEQGLRIVQGPCVHIKFASCIPSGGPNTPPLVGMQNVLRTQHNSQQKQGCVKLYGTLE